MAAILEALSQLSLDFMEKITTSETLSIEGISFEGKLKIFGLAKMLDATIVNLHRIELFWDLVIAHFVCISNSKNHVLRCNGVENLSILIQHAFQFFLYKKSALVKTKSLEEVSNQSPALPIQVPENSNGKVSDVDHSNIVDNNAKMMKWEPNNWQNTIFQPWVEVCKSKFVDVKDIISQNLLKLIQNNGHEINVGGWQIILNISYEISSEYHQNTTSTGFKCLEMIINDYLQVMNLECFNILVKVVDNFKRTSSKIFLSYLM